MTFHQAKIHILPTVIYKAFFRELNYKLLPFRKIDLVVTANYVEKVSCLFIVLFR